MKLDCRKRLAYLILGVIVVGGAGIVRFSLAGEAAPIVDIQCQLPAKDRESRLAALDRHVKVLEGQIKITQELITDYTHQLDRMNKAYVWSKRAMITATIASLLSGAEAAYDAYWLSRGFTLFRFTFSVAQARAIVVGSLSMRALELPEQIRFIRFSNVAISKEVQEQYEAKLESYSKEPLVSESALRYFTERDCAGGHCSFLQPQLEAALQDAMERARQAEQNLESTDRWWKPDAFTHLTGRLLGEVYIPWNQTILMIEKMQLAYAGALRDAMAQDHLACDRLQ